MLQSGFLGTLSDWVTEQTAQDVAVMDKAAEAFGLRKLLASTEEREKILALFSEWLVFDCKQDIFDGKTGLEFFVERNPLHLPEDKLSAYKDMLSFDAGLFEVKNVERGKGITLASVVSGTEQFVYDINASLSFHGTETIWARIAPVSGLYHGVGSLFVTYPRVMEGMSEAMRTWKRNSFDAKMTASWIAGPKASKPAVTPSYEESRNRFENALKKCGMDGFFSLETFADWASSEEKYDTDFALHALDGLTPDDVEFKDTAELIRVAGEFTNNIPRQSLKGKTPNEASRERQSRGEAGDWETDIFSKEKYIKVLEQASKHMAEGEFEKSYKAFEQIVKNLLKDRLPIFHVFRIYANAAVCCFHKGDIQLGEALLDASLRLNPLYDFAERQKERYAKHYNPALVEDFAALPKKEQKMLRSTWDDMCATGKRMYQHRVFSKYEKFLKELGISLVYRTKTKQVIHSFDEDGKPVKSPKIGRNDPCLCGSNKKFKKCCGA